MKVGTGTSCTRVDRVDCGSRCMTRCVARCSEGGHSRTVLRGARGRSFSPQPGWTNVSRAREEPSESRGALARAMSVFVYDPEDERTQRDPYPTYRLLRNEFPVYRQERLRFWTLSRFADVYAAVTDHATFSSAQGLTWDTSAAEQAGVLPMLVTTDPPHHTALRKLINRGLTPRRVADLEPAIRQVMLDAINALRADGGGDLVTDLAVPLPTAVIGRFLGVPISDRAEFHHWATGVVSGTSGAAFHEEHHRAIRALYGYFRELIARRRATPVDDLLSALLASELDGAR